MNVKKVLPKLLIVLFVVAFGFLCAFTGDVMAPNATLWSLYPPVIAIGLALITKEVYSSLFVGILAGGLLATSFNPIHTVDAVVSDGLISAVSGTSGIFIFLVLLGVIVALLNKAGGSKAFGQWAAKHVKTKIGASLATFAFGVLIFIDDYFNCLTVGAVMRPVTDQTKMSRSKLAYLIDATAAPVCMIAPISSWAAAVASYAGEGQGISLFCRAIPYNLYSLMTFVFIIAITLMKFDYGPMKLHEKNAENGDLFTGGEISANDEEEPSTGKAKVIDLVLPILLLIAICVFALFYVGRCMGEEWVFASANYDPSLSFIDAFSNTDATVGLPWGGLIALIVVMIYFVARRLLTFKEAMECIPKGFIAMVPAILILTMATTLKNMTNLLGSDVFVDNALANAGALNHFLPAIIFLCACGISFSTGTSWGTFGILIPIVLTAFGVETEMGIICMSACLAGSVCGDHCSPHLRYHHHVFCRRPLRPYQPCVHPTALCHYCGRHFLGRLPAGRLCAKRLHCVDLHHRADGRHSVCDQDAQQRQSINLRKENEIRSPFSLPTLFRRFKKDEDRYFFYPTAYREYAEGKKIAKT